MGEMHAALGFLGFGEGASPNKPRSGPNHRVAPSPHVDASDEFMKIRVRPGEIRHYDITTLGVVEMCQCLPGFGRDRVRKWKIVGENRGAVIIQCLMSGNDVT